jgi:hypothetical protein
MFATLSKMISGRFVAKKAPAAKQVARACLGVEQLDQRLLPSTVPALVGVTLNLDWSPVAVPTRTLTIESETDNGNGTGTFTALFTDKSLGTTAFVQGTISLKQVPSGVGQRYDYGLSYAGLGPSYFGDAAWVVGSGDFTTTSINTSASSYTQYTSGNPYWGYTGSDTEILYGAFYNDCEWSHSDSDPQAVWLH